MEIDDICNDLKKEKTKDSLEYYNQRVKEMEQYLNKIQLNPSMPSTNFTMIRSPN